MSRLSAPTGIVDRATLVRLQIDRITVGDRLRKLLPDRVATMAEAFGDKGQLEPIDVVQMESGGAGELRLVDGAVRVAAALQNGETYIAAVLHPPGTFGSELDIREREIAKNFIRFDLTALERAVYIAEWRVIHETKHPPVKPGRKAKPQGDDALEESSANFALKFTDVVQRTLGLSRRAIFLDLKVASIPADAREQIAPLAIARKQSELLLLADVPAGLLHQVVALLLDGAESVADAIATLEQRPVPSKLLPHERLSEGFSRLKQDQQFAFFELHSDAIDLWRAQRGGK